MVPFLAIPQISPIEWVWQAPEAIPMRASAKAAFLPWISLFEGSLPRPYQDVHGAVTVGIGMLCPLSCALGLLWRVPSTGQLAGPTDVRAAYAALLALPPGNGGVWYQSRVDLAIDPDSLEQWTEDTLLQFESTLRSPAHVGPAWDALPAVAQLARFRTAWADGPQSQWPHLDAALARGDWDTAMIECWPGDTATQPSAYRASYRAVRELYGLAATYPGDQLPDPLPTGAVTSPAA